MSNPSFENSELFISQRSPFARRVRLAFLESGIRFQEKVFNVFEPTSELLEVNPLGRVPTLKLASGEVIIDSNVILNLFYNDFSNKVGTQPIPPSLDQKLKVSYWSALGVGLSEKVVEYFLETLRPGDKQDADVEKELLAISARVLERLEAHFCSSNASYLVGNSLSQADIDMVTALTYMDLRYPRDWKKQFPQTGKFVEKMENRDHFKKTRPVL